ncbi:glycosyltransferase [Alteromonas aestuariivivens]|uniref:Glycosyltransferase n=1 Tax=Alteromonas aestuariivivens TaxID=1938339 RepID=A0A3D8M950_9ALTE|nr:glycosyltransferase family 2 protein [Alteromonas aestuariivivens]RDV26557.1 glycosyltransferase [Alteromonas aestuariivivens]
MKKSAMLTVKGIIGLLPAPLKNKLKTNAFLTELYSRSLRRSGLFYGYPNKKMRFAMYQKYLGRQEDLLARRNSSAEMTGLNIVIFGGEDIELTLQSISSVVSNAGRIFLIGEVVTYPVCKSVATLAEAAAEIDNKLPTLFLNSGDTLSHFAQSEFGKAAAEYELVYSDTDSEDDVGHLKSPRFLPDWNPDLQISTAYVQTAVVVNNSLLSKLGLEAVGSIPELIVLAWLSFPNASVGHLPYTLVHSRKTSTNYLASVAKVLQNHMGAQISEIGQHQVNSVLWSRHKQPLVSLIIPTKDGKELVKACIESIQTKTKYKNYEILLIDNGSEDPASLAYFEELNAHSQIRVLKYPGPFNYSAINNFGVAHAKGEVVGLINNDIEVISPLWLDYMVGHVLRGDVGCVGAKLLYSDGRIQHAGVVLGYGGGAGHAHKYYPHDHPGYMNRLIATQSFSAVTAACLLVRRELFEQVGGLNERDLAVAFNDVDFCLRIRELGKRNIYCAEAELYHHESVSRGLDISPEKAARFNKELRFLQSRWAKVIKHDPAYNPNLTLKRENFAIKEEHEYISEQNH